MRDVPRSHPQAGGPVLTTLRAACLLLRLKVVTLRAACLFLMPCKVEYKTHVRLESGAEVGFAAPLGSALQGCRAAFPGIVPTDFHGLTRKARKLQGCGSAFPGRLVVLW